MVGSPLRTSDLWTRLFWADKNTDKPSGAILSPSLQFQVASCGGSSAETPDLARCGISDIADQSADDQKGIKQANGGGNPIAADNSNGAENESNTPSAPDQGSQPSAVLNLSPLMPADIFASYTQISPLPAPIDAPQGLDSLGPLGSDSLGPPGSDSLGPLGSDSLGPPDSDSLGPPGSDSLGPPGSPPLDPSIGDPWSVSGSPPAPPIPETSTEVMTMLGFGMMFLASRRRTRNSIKDGLVRAFCKITNKSLHQYSA
jgi:hypothetical protein